MSNRNVQRLLGGRQKNDVRFRTNWSERTTVSHHTRRSIFSPSISSITHRTN